MSMVRSWLVFPSFICSGSTSDARLAYQRWPSTFGPRKWSPEFSSWRRLLILCSISKFLGKGYKVGRVEQAETALGAEMRLAADKGKGKVSADKEKDKIVRR